MKSLSKHLQESLNEENKSIVDIVVRDGNSELGLPESNEEEAPKEVTNEEVVTEEKPSE